MKQIGIANRSNPTRFAYTMSMSRNLVSTPNERLLEELITTVDFCNGQTYPPRGRRRLPPDSPTYHPDRH